MRRESTRTARLVVIAGVDDDGLETGVTGSGPTIKAARARCLRRHPLVEHDLPRRPADANITTM